jgi:hypothetical protein
VSLALQVSDGSLTLVVRDNGIGIEAGFLPHVFERFRQADASTTPNRPTRVVGLSELYVPAINSFPAATAQYSDPLSIGGVFYGDLYLRLAIDFGDGFGGSVGLRMDTDNVPVGTPIDRVPEPVTSALLGVGLLGLAARVRRRASR